MKLAVAAALVGAMTLVVATTVAADTFADPVGDSKGAPDITQVDVTNTPNGQITIRIAMPATAGFAPESGIQIYFETDGNSSTGDDVGLDYGFQYDATGLLFVKFDGEQEDATIPRSTLSASFTGGALTLSINRSELGQTKTLRLLALSFFDTGPETADVDLAPDSGIYTFTLTLPVVLVLTAGKPVGIPARPVAGKPFVVAVPVTRSDTKGPLGSGVVACTAAAGSRAIAARGRMAAGLARCSMKMPKAAKGKLLRGKVTTVSGQSRVTRAYVFRVI